jgi:hypothetical protein
MTRYLKLWTALLLAAFLSACGGGGGSPGTPSTGVGSGSQPTKSVPTLALSLRDASGAPTNSISASGNSLLTVLLADPSGNPMPNQLIDVAGDANQVVFPEGNTGLTNASGVATIKVARASLTASGAGSLTATYNFKLGAFAFFPNGSPAPAADTVYTAVLSYQLSATNITLTNLDVGTSPLAAYGTRQISVQANVNGAAAVGTSVVVNFTASCGQIAPASVATNANAVAVATYTATDATGSTSTQGCGGRTVELTATTPGGGAVSKTFGVTAAPATNMSFVSVTPSRIYLANSGGPTQSIAEFKLVNALGEPLQGQSVVLSLKTSNGGIPKATLGSVGNTAPVTLTTDAAGKVAVPVFSGTVPTNVVINAALASNPAVQTDSSILTIASGRAAQARVSLSIEKLSIEGFSTDGAVSGVTLSLADRQGNPVPDGTAVNFVTEGGVMIPPVCTTGSAGAGNSQCSVQIRSQNPRSANGRVSILAYVTGEEDFVDSNFNNVYDCGESFTDLGTAFRDDNENGGFDTGEFSVPRDAAPSACGASMVPTPQNGDGVWGAADVRRQATIIFATSQAIITGVFQPPVTSSTTTGTVTTSVTETVGLDVVVSDLNGNSMPTGSTITLSVVDRTSDTNTCVLVGASTFTVPNTLAPVALVAGFKGCRTGDQVNVRVTTPGNLSTPRDFTIP